MDNKPTDFWPELSLDQQLLDAAVDRFRELIVTRDAFDQAFVSFDQGLAAEWEWYKTELWRTARALSGAQQWKPGKVGKGDILEGAVDAIERGSANFFDGSRQYGPPASRLQEAAKGDANLRKVEGILYDVIWGDDPEAALQAIVALIGRQYSLVAFLFWLRDDASFMPILTNTFDQALDTLGVPLKTTGQLSWDNYTRFNGALAHIAVGLEGALNQRVRLVDAHSFCYMLVKLEAEAPAGQVHSGRQQAELDPLEATIRTLAGSIRSTSAQSGKLRVSRTKVKPLEIDLEALEPLMRELFRKQKGTCKLTGMPMQHAVPGSDPKFIASPDRIDSDGPYSEANLQLVCRFANFWKGDTPDQEFRQLLAQVKATS